MFAWNLLKTYSQLQRCHRKMKNGKSHIGLTQEKLKTMLMQNVWVTNKEQYGMLWYFLEWSINSAYKPNEFICSIRIWTSYLPVGVCYCLKS